VDFAEFADAAASTWVVLAGVESAAPGARLTQAALLYNGGPCERC
jgi:hypothetical protein